MDQLYQSNDGIVEDLGIQINLKTVKDLVDQSPFSFPGVEDYIYVGSKVTKVFKIDIQTGEIIQSAKLIITDRDSKFKDKGRLIY